MRHKILIRLAALTTAFGVGLTIYLASLFMPSSRSTAPEYELKTNLVECRMVTMFEREFHPELRSRVSEYFMAIENDSFNGFNLNQAIDYEEGDPYLFESNCGTLVVDVTSEGKIHLNSSKELGTVNAPGFLGQRLRGILDERIQNRAYRENIENNPNFAAMTEEEKVAPLQVLIRPACENKYEDVLRVLETVKSAGAEQVALQVGNCNMIND